jgi:hypothetical protein
VGWILAAGSVSEFILPTFFKASYGLKSGGARHPRKIEPVRIGIRSKNQKLGLYPFYLALRIFQPLILLLDHPILPLNQFILLLVAGFLLWRTKGARAISRRRRIAVSMRWFYNHHGVEGDISSFRRRTKSWRFQRHHLPCPMMVRC